MVPMIIMDHVHVHTEEDSGRGNLSPSTTASVANMVHIYECLRIYLTVNNFISRICVISCIALKMFLNMEFG